MKRNHTDETGCISKIRYPTRKDAQVIVKALIRRKMAPLSIYACRYCDGFHLATIGKARKKIGPRTQRINKTGNESPEEAKQIGKSFDRQPPKKLPDPIPGTFRLGEILNKELNT